jgi:hydroxymethylpyrimidine/phosphomethylpyrimidine kinase
VFAELPPKAVKTGMLYTAANVRVVADFFGARAARPRVPLVVDPVMVSTSGAPLLVPAAKQILLKKLFPLATLATPNLDEVAAILGTKPNSLDAMRHAAREIHRRYGCAVLVKGGHLHGKGAAVDIFYDGANELELTASKVFKIRTHGTGCTFSAAICAALALGNDLPVAVRMAKRFITSAIEHSYRIGKHLALDQTRHLPERW